MLSQKKTTSTLTVPVVPHSVQKRFTHWLCGPDGKCAPYEQEPREKNYNWRIFRIMSEFIEGFEFLSKLRNEVSIFGSARAKPGTKYYKLARDLGQLLGKHGYTVVTGGGAGIMEAANRGSYEVGGESAGLNIELPVEQRLNRFVIKAVEFHHFFVRKVMLSASAQAYVFFPGGFGTIDEMTEMLTLIQTGKIPKNIPLILFGSEYWQPFLDWASRTICNELHFIKSEDMQIMRLVDTPREAFEIIRTTMERRFE